MKKRHLISLVIVAIISSVVTVSPVRADFLNTLKKVGEAAKEIGSEIEKAKAAQPAQPKRTPRNTYRQGKMEIDTGNPNLSIKVLKCEGFGNKAVLSLMLQNVSGKNININIQGWRCSAVDSSGRTIEGNNKFAIRIGRNKFDSEAQFFLPAEVKAKIIIQVSDITEHAKFLKSITLFNSLDGFGDIIIKNIDIDYE